MWAHRWAHVTATLSRVSTDGISDDIIERARQLIVGGLSIRKAAAECGINKKTIQRRLGRVGEIRAGQHFAEPMASRGSPGPRSAARERLPANFRDLLSDEAPGDRATNAAPDGQPTPASETASETASSPAPRRGRSRAAKPAPTPARPAPPPTTPRPAPTPARPTRVPNTTPSPGPIRDGVHLGLYLPELLPDGMQMPRRRVRGQQQIVCTVEQLRSICSILRQVGGGIETACYRVDADPTAVLWASDQGKADLLRGDRRTASARLHMAIECHRADWDITQAVALSRAAERGTPAAIRAAAERAAEHRPDLREFMASDSKKAAAGTARQLHALIKGEEADVATVSVGAS